jgi:hypothetical protein
MPSFPRSTIKAKIANFLQKSAILSKRSRRHFANPLLSAVYFCSRLNKDYAY